jgi:hypothetical protein
VQDRRAGDFGRREVRMAYQVHNPSTSHPGRRISCLAPVTIRQAVDDVSKGIGTGCRENGERAPDRDVDRARQQQAWCRCATAGWPCPGQQRGIARCVGEIAETARGAEYSPCR